MQDNRFRLGQRLRGTRQPTTFLGVAMIGLIWAGLAFHLSKEKDSALESAKQNSGNLVRVFEEHVIRVVEQANKALLSLRARYEKSPEQFDIENARVYLDNLVLQISVISADGMLKLSTTAPPPGTPIDLSDRDHFRAHLISGKDALLISKPMLGRISGKASVQLSRRLNKPDGSFNGMIVASIDQSSLARFYSSIDVGHDGTIVVMGTDKIVRVSRGFKNIQADGSYPVRFLFKKLQESPTGFFVTSGQVDGIARLVSYRKVESLPLIVAVGLAKHEVLQDYSRAARTHRRRHLLLESSFRQGNRAGPHRSGSGCRLR